MDWGVTLGVILGAAGLSVFAGWRGARPSDLVRGPRLIPWRLVMVLAAAPAGQVQISNFEISEARSGLECGVHVQCSK